MRSHHRIASIAGFCVAVAAVACAIASSSPAATTPAACSGAAGTPDHVVLVMMENHSYTSIAGHSPYLNGLANQCAVSGKTAYANIVHPSLSNYMALTAGQTIFAGQDCQPTGGCQTGADSIFAHESQPKVYAESMNTYCQHSGSGEYAPRHTAFPYFTAVASLCKTNDVPFGSSTKGFVHDVTAGTLPTFSLVAPNLIHDEHDGSVSQGDAWLKTYVGKLIAGPQYRAGRVLVIVTYDETGSGSGGIYATFAAPEVKRGVTLTASFNHYSVLRLAEDLTTARRIGHSADAVDLRAALGL